MKNIIIDCDPGHDDIMAILSAFANSDKLNILGFTTVCGNQTVDKVTTNLCRVLSYLGINHNVYIGESMPLFYSPEPQPMAHGESGLDGPVLFDGNVKAKEGYIDFFDGCLKNKVTILALGPLTNIAKLIMEKPDLISNIEQIVIMGGSLSGGNILPNAEFNIYADPHAAKIVFDSGIDIVLAPLEVCDDCSLKHKIIDSFKGKGHVSNLAYEILEFFSRYSKARNRDKSPIFDLACTLYLLYSDKFIGKKANINVVLEGENRGQTVIDFNNNGNVLVLLQADNDFLQDKFIDHLDILDSKYSI